MTNLGFLRADLPFQSQLRSGVSHNLEDAFSARGVGEHVMVPTAPAMANAIYDALGIRFNDLPLSAEKVFQALQETGTP